MKLEAGQWWCMKDEPSVMVWSVGLSACGNWVIEWSDGTTSMSCPDDFYHEPRCTGWDWVVPEPQPAEDPDEWVILDPVKYAEHVPRTGIDWFMDGKNEWVLQASYHDSRTVGDHFRWCDKHHRCRRRDLPKVEQVEKTSDGGINWSYYEKQKSQPKKTMLRLWIDSDCNIHAGLKGDRDLELHYDHETRQFYTEETR